MLQPLHGLVIQVYVRGPERRSALHFISRSTAYGKAVVLRCDFNRSVLQPSNWMVRCPVAVKQLVCSASESPAEQLVPKANSENRNPPLGKGPNGLQGVLDRLRVARSIGKEESVRILLEQGLGPSLRGEGRDPAAT